MESSQKTNSTHPRPETMQGRHWVSLEELHPDYWQDPQVQEQRGQEFFEKPVEWLEKLQHQEIDRRNFLTLMGASMAMASFACVRKPVHKIIPYVVKPEEITLGVPNRYASSCQECTAGCGLVVKTREGRPIKLEGNPQHPINQGALCARGQASLLNLYDLDRLKTPILRAPFQRELTWEQVDTQLVERFQKIATSGRIRLLTPPLLSPATRRLVQEFLKPFRQARHIEFDPLELSQMPVSQEISYGSAGFPRYHFDQAKVIVSLGADFLGHWISPVEHAKDWAQGRKLQGQEPQNATLSKMYCFEPTLSLTGSKADERYPVRPGDELKIAMALMFLIMTQHPSAPSVQIFAKEAAWMKMLNQYQPERVAKDIGFPAQVLYQIAAELWNHRGKSLVVAGSFASQTSQALALQVMTHALNSILENEGQTIDGTQHVRSEVGSLEALLQLFSEIKAGQVDLLLVYRLNPVYTFSGWGDVGELFQKVPCVVHVSDRIDETGQCATYVLPDSHPLESWGEVHPRRGVYSLQQPTIAPLHSTRSFQENLLSWIQKATFPQSERVKGVTDWHEYLKNDWKTYVYPLAQRTDASVKNFDEFWIQTLQTGVFQEPLTQPRVARKFQMSALRHPSFSQIPSIDAESLLLSLYAKISLADGRSANNPWLQEMPDPISTVTWDNYLNVSPQLAEKLSLKSHEVVEVSVGEVKRLLPIYIQPGLHPQVVSVALGYGHSSAGRIAQSTGVSVFPWVQFHRHQAIFSGHLVSLKKTGRVYRLAATQWHHLTENRPIINDVLIAEYRKNPATHQKTDPPLRLDSVPSLWPSHEYPSYRWGMAIDLNTCTGCGACVMACQAENNIPVVGRDQVRVSRQMHWIRIDRYYAGTPENPEVVFQPMLCQHCENAPCETVCPVLATVHDDEGLNVQVYNRCVGTRYCQNNCPYKVRRFNFFDHWKSEQVHSHQVLNPDVTARTRGIMEKCTFCVQRIRDAKEKAKNESRRVDDGQLQTACQQTCPTQAIVFGDLNDPNSRVTRMKESPQAFRVLEVLNTRPSISYMTQVRNKERG